MTVQAGYLALFGRENATYAGSYDVIGGQQTLEFEYTDQAAAYTHKCSTGLWQELMDGGTKRALRWDGSGVILDDSAYDALFAAIQGSSTRHQDMGLLLPGHGLIAATFQVSTSQNDGQIDQPAGFRLSMMSAGDITFVPGVTNKYEMQASVVLDFIASSLWVAGVHQTAWASVANAAITRASKKYLPADWDFTDGGIVSTSLATVASGVLAVDATRGALIEVATTNEIRNPRAEGSTNGDISGAGVLPQTALGSNAGDWSAAYSGGTITVVGTGTEDGFPYIDLRFSGTFSGETFLLLEATGIITAAASETWTFSCGVKLVGGTDPARFRIVIAEYMGGTFQAYDRHAIITLDANHRRWFHTATLADGDTDNAVPLLYLESGLGAIDFTVRVYAPQFEEKAYPTSPMLPDAASPGAATRAADVVSLQATAGWHNASAHTIFADLTSNKTGSLEYVFSLNDAANADYVSGYLNSGGSNILGVETSVSVLSKALDGTDPEAGVRRQFVYAFSDSDSAMRDVGGAMVTDATFGVSPNAYDEIMLGCTPSGMSQLNGWLRRLVIVPKRLTNTELSDWLGV